MAMKTGPLSQSISHSDQRQFSAATENPEMSGPNAGPHVAAKAQMQSTYGSLIRLYMSCRLAPPVARQGEPKKPRRNRRTSKPAKFSTRAAGTQRMTKMAMVIM